MINLDCCTLPHRQCVIWLAQKMCARITFPRFASCVVCAVCALVGGSSATVILDSSLVGDFLAQVTNFSTGPIDMGVGEPSQSGGDPRAGNTGSDRVRAEPPVAFLTCRRCTGFVHPRYWRMYLSVTPDTNAPPVAVVEVHPCRAADPALPVAPTSTNVSASLGLPFVAACAVAAHGFTVRPEILEAVNATVAAFEANDNRTRRFFSWSLRSEINATDLADDEL